MTHPRKHFCCQGELEDNRNKMKLGYEKDGEFKQMSSVALRNVMRTSDDEDDRKLAYNAMNGIGEFVLDNGFTEVIKKRNKLAKMLGR